jgi:hypothetical protein
MATSLPPTDAKPARVTLAQTLHGYDQGHRLLARGGDIDANELAILDRLSDLSGYLPLGTEFDRYHTGFPCGRYYAFACTWSDTAATRAGTVLTHTLLLPQSLLEGVQDPWGLGRWHRRPAAASDRAPYESPITVEGGELAAQGARRIEPARALDALVLWFGQPERPILWVEDTRPDDVVAFLMRMLWPEWRRTFAFCTFALQVRYIIGRPFDWLALPPSARGSFHDQARSSAWWQEGGQPRAALREFGEKPWMRSILESDGEPLREARGFCLEHGLMLPAPQKLAVYFRFRELEGPAKERLTAARARADLFFRLFEGIAPMHELSRSVLNDLLLRQPDAPLAPQPFWEIIDFLGRPQVRALADADVVFDDDIGRHLASDLPRRLEGAGEVAAADLPQLLAVASRGTWRSVVLTALRGWMRRSVSGDPAGARAERLWEGALARSDFEVMEMVLAELVPAQRKLLYERSVGVSPALDQPAAVERMLRIAGSLSDPLFAFAIRARRAEPLEGLREATRIVLAEPEPRPEQLAPICALAGAEERLLYSLETTEHVLSAWASTQGAAAARELGLKPAELVERCKEAPNGVRVLMSWIHLAPYREAEEAMRAAGDMAFELLRLSLQETRESSFIVRMAVKSLGEDRLLDPILADALMEGGGTPGARQLVHEIVRPLLRAIVLGSLSSERAAPWLRVALVQDELGSLGYWPFYDHQAGSRHPSCLPNLSRAIAAALEHDPSMQVGWTIAILRYPLDEPPASSLASAMSDLLTLLGASWGEEGPLDLSMWILHAIRKSGSPTSLPVERTFPVVYPRLMRGQLGYLRAEPLRFPKDTWDLAKAWRHWIVDTWIDAQWPGPSFLRCLGNDEALFRRLAYRASRSWAGRAFLKRLETSLANEPELAAFWRGPVERVMSDPEFFD